MSKWWELSIEELGSKIKGTHSERISTAFDRKYGKYDYSTDLRRLCEDQFIKRIDEFTSDLEEDALLLICGANNGYEVQYLKRFNITALDLSTTALMDLKKSFPLATIVEGTMDDLPFEADTFDAYINLRAIQSVGVNMPKAVEEAKRVTKKEGKILFSVPNGYMDEGRIVKGMVTGSEALFDPMLPYKLASEIEVLLDQLEMVDRNSNEIVSEIFVQAKK